MTDFGHAENHQNYDEKQETEMSESNDFVKVEEFNKYTEYLKNEIVTLHGKEDKFYAVGNLSKAAVKQFGPGAYHFDDRDELVANMESYLDAGSKVLVKGSASMKMQNIVDKLKQSQKQAIKE